PGHDARTIRRRTEDPLDGLTVNAEPTQVLFSHLHRLKPQCLEPVELRELRLVQRHTFAQRLLARGKTALRGQARALSRDRGQRLLALGNRIAPAARRKYLRIKRKDQRTMPWQQGTP